MQTGADSLADRAARAFTAHRDGDSSGMSDLVDLVTPLLWHTARGQGLAAMEAEDVVQNTWLQLVQHADRISDPQAVLKWLLTTTRREAWSVGRRGRRVDAVDTLDLVGTAEDVDASTGPEDLLLRGESQATVWRHYARLPQRCQALLRVIAFSERPDYAHVAQALGMPVGSIGPTRGRCLAKLRAALVADPSWGGESA